MILLTPEGHLAGIIFVKKRQGINHAEWWVYGEGHVSAIVTHNCADCPTHGVGGLPFYLHQGTGILDELHDGTDMPNWSHALSNNKPDACTFQCCTPVLGFKRIKMAVVQLYSPSAMHSGLKLPSSAHFSRTAMGMVCIHKVVWILVKHMSPKRRPPMLCRTEIGIEGGI